MGDVFLVRGESVANRASGVATPGALEATTPQQMAEFLQRHAAGDWGCIGEEDWTRNDAAVTEGERILSAYPIDPAKPCKGCLWVITEQKTEA